MSDAAAALILSEPLAGLQAQAIGLAEAARLPHELRALTPAAALEMGGGEALATPLPRWRIRCARRCRGWLSPAAAWVPPSPPRFAAAAAAVVQVQHPRLDPRRFDLIVVNRHDGLTGPNVVVTRTALHRATPERLAAAAAAWRDRFAHLPRPLVAVLIGGSNGRYRPGRRGRRAACRHRWPA